MKIIDFHWKSIGIYWKSLDFIENHRFSLKIVRNLLKISGFLGPELDRASCPSPKSWHSKMPFEREEWRSVSDSNGTVTGEFQTIKIEELIFWSSGAKRITFSGPRLRRHSRLSRAELGWARPNSAEAGRTRILREIRGISLEIDGNSSISNEIYWKSIDFL